MSNLFGFNISKRRLQSILPFFVKMGDLNSWANQCLCARCTNCEYSIIFLNKLGIVANDPLLTILDLSGLRRVICCDGVDERICLSSLVNQKCFLHGNKLKMDCQGKRPSLIFQNS